MKPLRPLLAAALLLGAAFLIGASSNEANPPAPVLPHGLTADGWIKISNDVGIALDRNASKSSGSGQLSGTLYVLRDGEWRRVMLGASPAAQFTR